MKKEIQFRGKVHSDNLELLESIGIKHEKGWVTGSFITPDLIVGDLTDVAEDYFATEWWINVIPETVGQFTGLLDKNGVKIYEGDIVDWVDSDYNIRRDVVRWINGGLVLCSSRYTVGSYPQIEVIGTIYDNPEMLEL